MKTIIVSSLVLLVVSGCSSVSTQSRPPNYYTNPGISQATTPSLFTAGNGNLTNAQIANLLNYKVKLPTDMRIAIVQLGDSGTLQSDYMFQQNYRDDALQSIFPGLIAILRKSPHVYDASYLPSMLLPAKRGIESMRSAAARYQADLLLVYQNRCDVFNEYHVFSPNEVQANCVVQSALIDVRSGIVVFTSVSSQKLHATKSKSDLNFDLTVQKARLKAISDGLDEIATNIDGFLTSTSLY